MTSTLILEVPFKIASELNPERHGRWGQKAKNTKIHRALGYVVTLAHLPRRDGETLAETIGDWFPATVWLVRIGVQRLDDDNVAGAFKHVRDGIAQALGVDDGHPLFRWRYRQETKHPRLAYGFRMAIVTTGAGNPNARREHRVDAAELRRLQAIGKYCERTCSARAWCRKPSCPGVEPEIGLLT